MSLLPTLGLTPTRTAATAGATSAIAPMVAIHPPSTDIHDVAGRTRTPRIAPSYKESSTASWCTTLASPSPDSRLGERCLRAGRFRERLGEVGLFPRQIGPTKMSVRGGLPVDRPAQREALDDRAGPEVEMLLDELADRFV